MRFYLSIWLFFICFGISRATELPRVIITTDINAGRGDPDDRQSLCHLLWYANTLDIRGIIPDRFSPSAIEACTLALDCYQKDFNAPKTKFRELNFPAPESVREDILIRTRKDAIATIIQEASREDDRSLWILAWGNLRLIGDALEAEPSISSGIRLVSIGTNVKAKESGGDGHEINWNGAGRQVIFSQFPKLWWLEIDWTYNGMFHGPEAIQLKQDLAACGGELGQHIADVISSVPWADNFRAGDTPSVLYLIDPDNNKDDPSEISWAGRFIQPFPKTRPNYWTGITGGVAWNFSTPSESWHNASSVYQARSQTLRVQRPEMYESLLNRVQFLYGTLGYQRSDRPDNSAIFHPSAQLILEAENARYRGTLSRKDKSASNETFIYLDNKCWVAWRFQFDDKPAKFSMSLRYRTKKREPHKLTLFVNGANLGEREFPTDSREWETLDFEAFLETGPNSVVLRHESGTLEIDRLRIGK